MNETGRDVHDEMLALIDARRLRRRLDLREGSRLLRALQRPLVTTASRQRATASRLTWTPLDDARYGLSLLGVLNGLLGVYVEVRPRRVSG